MGKGNKLNLERQLKKRKKSQKTTRRGDCPTFFGYNEQDEHVCTLTKADSGDWIVETDSEDKYVPYSKMEDAMDFCGEKFHVKKFRSPLIFDGMS